VTVAAEAKPKTRRGEAGTRMTSDLETRNEKRFDGLEAMSGNDDGVPRDSRSL